MTDTKKKRRSSSSAPSGFVDEVKQLLWTTGAERLGTDIYRGGSAAGADVEKVADALYNRWKQGISGEAKDLKSGDIGDLLAGGGPIGGAPKKDAPATKKKAAATPAAKAYQQEQAWQKAIADSPFTKLMDTVQAQYQTAQQAASAASSPSAVQQATQGAFSTALTSLSGTPSVLGGTPSAWLSQNLAAGQKATQGLTSAISAVGQAEAAQAGPIDQALKALGQGNALGVMTASTDAWLNAVASHILSNMGYYGQVPSAISGKLPSSIGEALSLYGGEAGGAGVIPVQELTTKGAYTTVKRGATGRVKTTALSTGGTVPAVSKTGTGPAPG